MEESKRRILTPKEKEIQQYVSCVEEKEDKIKKGSQEVVVRSKTHVEEKTSVEEKKKRKHTEENLDNKKKIKLDDKEILQGGVHGLREEQKDKKRKTKRPRSPEDPLEGGSGYKKPCLDVKRPAPLDIESYRFHKDLGRGSFGRVMLATFAPKKQLVAIKIISKKTNKSNYENIKKEARLLKMANSCPFLCHSYAAFQSEIQAFFVLEYASGGSLYKMISRKGKLPMERVKFYTAEIVIGLQFLHSNGIVHCDLKPDNILVDMDGHIKICDFGLSAEGLFGEKMICRLSGTPGYRAPEVLIMNDYNAGADWWSFGVIMYEMATGNLPFAPSVSALREVSTIKSSKPDYPSHMSQEMLDLLSKLLEIDQKKRLGVKGNIREHPFYATIKWKRMEKRRVKTPFRPKKPSAGELPAISPGFPADSSKREKVEELSYVASTWNWQE
ncbi:protein kinase C delta type-like [Xenopus tropicalis]|uniref:Protein kinase C delta type-like n=1 Tax=Xenopus tropicalis TaxID=8364 RepID=A0A803JGB8_XENTR|nr:protein kinase C delta type-like [Xenopus tropicalis]